MERVPINDLYTAAFLWLSGVEPELRICGTRVTFSSLQTLLPIAFSANIKPIP